MTHYALFLTIFSYFVYSLQVKNILLMIILMQCFVSKSNKSLYRLIIFLLLYTQQLCTFQYNNIVYYSHALVSILKIMKKIYIYIILDNKDFNHHTLTIHPTLQNLKKEIRNKVYAINMIETIYVYNICRYVVLIMTLVYIIYPNILFSMWSLYFFIKSNK